MVEENLESLSQKASSLEEQYNTLFFGTPEERAQWTCKDLPYHGELVADILHFMYDQHGKNGHLPVQGKLVAILEKAYQDQEGFLATNKYPNGCEDEIIRRCSYSAVVRKLYHSLKSLGELLYARAQKGKAPEGLEDFTITQEQLGEWRKELAECAPELAAFIRLMPPTPKELEQADNELITMYEERAKEWFAGFDPVMKKVLEKYSTI